MTPLRIAAAAAAAALAAACAIVFGATFEAAVNAAGCVVLVAVTVTDLERRIIPNRIVVPAMVVALIVQTARDPSVEWILAALGAGGFFFLAALAYPAGMGMGDVKLAAFLGAWLGSAVIVGIFAGCLIAMLPAVALFAVKGARARKIGLPFAPFLSAGAVIALFWGDRLLDWWLG